MLADQAKRPPPKNVRRLTGEKVNSLISPLRGSVIMESTMAALCLADDQDRISSLPDPILHYILYNGLLSMDEVVRTCILSKRWKSLWASMPYLYFDCIGSWADSCEGNEDKINIVEFIDTVLLLRDGSDVQAFKLLWVDVFPVRMSHNLAKWMRYAVNHNVKDLSITVDLDEVLFKLPSCVFTCQSLEVLRLNFTERYVDVPSALNLGRLRELMLGRFTLDHVSLNALISGCPVLEDMFIFRSMLEDPDIASNSLKKLRILRCWIRGTRIRISCPSMHTLDFVVNNFQNMEVSLENLSSLTEAVVPIDSQRGEFFDDSAYRLYFKSPRSETFLNLKKLELRGWNMVGNFPAVHHFLQRSPNLDMLTVVQKNRRAANRESATKKFFDCPHRKVHVLAECGEKSDKITEMVIDSLRTKCGCSRE